MKKPAANLGTPLRGEIHFGPISRSFSLNRTTIRLK